MKPKIYARTIQCSSKMTHSTVKQQKHATDSPTKLQNNYAQTQQQCKVAADQVAHQLLLNGKGNSTHRPSKAKITDNHILKHSLTSLFTMAELM